MKCTNSDKKKGTRLPCRKMTAIILMLGLVLGLAGCGKSDYSIQYQIDPEISAYNVLYFAEGRKAETFSANLCVVTDNVIPDEEIYLGGATAGLLVDINNRGVLFSKNAHARMAPASLTKIMTAIVALKNGSLDQTLTATSAVYINEYGAQLAGINAGDRMTLDQALHILLIYSANDVANLIAENIGGSVENFVEMMNEEARMLGATNTHFMNPHGLDDTEHYTTAYDLYLMFNEAIKYQSFTEIIHMASYQTTYYDKDGKAKEFNKDSTNRFINKRAEAPENITVIGGKTGNTSAAGSCLMLFSRDTGGAPYISVLLNCTSADTMYSGMAELLKLISK